MGTAVPEALRCDGETDWVVEGWAGTGLAAEDPAWVVGYLLSPLRGQYLAVMTVLEQSVDQLTPAEVGAPGLRKLLRAAHEALPERLMPLSARLEARWLARRPCPRRWSSTRLGPPSLPGSPRCAKASA